jgi:hypothetical protein
MLSPRSAREAARAVVSDLAGLPVCPVTGTTDNHECQRRETPNRTGERHQLNYTIARACPLCRFKPGAWDRSTAVSLKTGTLRLSHSILGKTRDAPMSTPIAISRKCARDPEGPPDSVSATGCTTPPGLGLLSGDTAWVLPETRTLWGEAGAYAHDVYAAHRPLFPELPEQLPIVIGITAYGHCLGLTRGSKSGPRITLAFNLFATGRRRVMTP